jgi:DNA helicase-2/ATP-dependent DNA helicase PcrA
LGKNVKCEIDTETLNKSHRNNQKICDFSSRLFPTLPTPEACSCGKCRAGLADHNGVYFILREDVEKYLENFNPVQLRWNSLTKINKCHNFLNFGESKGLTFDRVLIYPTEDMKKWLIDNNSILAFGTRAKLYVGITRARKSCAFVWDDTKNYVAGAEYFSFG